MKDHKGDTGGKTGECEEDSGDDVQDGELGGAPVGKGAAGVEDQPKVGEVVAEALRLHLVAPLTHHLVEKKEEKGFLWKEISQSFFCSFNSPCNPDHSKVAKRNPKTHSEARTPRRPATGH